MSLSGHEPQRPVLEQRHQVGGDRLPERESLVELRRIEDRLDAVAVDRIGAVALDRIGDEVRRELHHAGPRVVVSLLVEAHGDALHGLEQRRQHEADRARADDVHPTPWGRRLKGREPDRASIRSAARADGGLAAAGPQRPDRCGRRWGALGGLAGVLKTPLAGLLQPVLFWSRFELRRSDTDSSPGDGRRRNGTRVKLIAVIAAGAALALAPVIALAANDSFTRTIAGGWGAADDGGTWTADPRRVISR